MCHPHLLLLMVHIVSPITFVYFNVDCKLENEKERKRDREGAGVESERYGGYSWHGVNACMSIG